MPSTHTITGPLRSLPVPRGSEALRLVGLALVTVALEVGLAHAAAAPEIPKYLYLFIGVFVAALVFRFPLATALVFLFLTDSIFYPTKFAHNVGSLSVRPHELALAALFVLAVVKPKRKTWGGTTGIALAVFLALVALSALLAVQAGRTNVTEAFNSGRPLGMLLFFYVVVRLFPSPEDRRVLLTGTAIFAAVTGVFAAMISFGGLSGTPFQEEGGMSVRTQEGLGTVERVRLSGLSAGYAMFWFSAVQVSLRRGPKRVGWLVLLAGIALDIAVSFNRNMWIGIFLGAVLMAIIGGQLVRNRMAAGLAVVVAGLAIFIFFGSSSKNTVVEPILQRGATILNPGKTSQEGSLQERGHETEIAWGVAQHNLPIGIGIGVPFGVFVEKNVTSGEIFFGTQKLPQLFLHDQYLYLILISGIPGLLAFIVFLGDPILSAVRRRPRDPAITACAVGVLLIMVSAVVAIYFTVEDMTAVLGLLTGVIVADRETLGALGRRSELVT